MAKQGGTVLSLDGGEPLDVTQHDLHQPFKGFYLFGDPDVVQRLRPLVRVRAKPATHPAW